MKFIKLWKCYLNKLICKNIYENWNENIKVFQYIKVSKHKMVLKYTPMYLKVSKLSTYSKLFEIMIIAKLPSLFKDSYL